MNIVKRFSIHCLCKHIHIFDFIQREVCDSGIRNYKLMFRFYRYIIIN
jgi:hypothetical protein